MVNFEQEKLEYHQCRRISRIYEIDSTTSQNILNMNFKLLENEKPEVVFPGDLDVTIIPPLPSPPSSAVDTDVNHEMLTSQ